MVEKYYTNRNKTIFITVSQRAGIKEDGDSFCIELGPWYISDWRDKSSGFKKTDTVPGCTDKELFAYLATARFHEIDDPSIIAFYKLLKLGR